MVLDEQQCDLLALREGQISARQRLRRRPEYRWWHSAGLPEPSRSHRLRYARLDSSRFAANARRDEPPEQLPLASPCHRGATG
jgi:hypothetical protein